MGSEYITSDFCRSPSASINADLEIKSEAESVEEIDQLDNDTSYEGSDIAQAESGIFSDCQGEKDDEDVLDEPLVDIDSISASQELVEVDQDPSLLLFVNRDSNSLACSKSGINLTKRQLSEEETVSRKAVTRALRNVKRKLPISRQDSCDKEIEVQNEVVISEDVTAIVCDDNSSSNISHVPTTKKKLLKNSKIMKNQDKKYVKVRKKCERKLMVFRRGKGGGPIRTNKTNPSLNKFTDVENERESHCENVTYEGKENTQNNRKDDKTSKQNNSNTVCVKKKQKQKTCENSKDKNKPVEMEKPESYDCTVCDKKFKEKSHLATHSRAHIEERNFRCDECDKTFKTKSNLHFHKKTHEEAPFTCEKCNKTFSERKILIRHIRVVHSGEGKFNCGDCGRPFKSARNLELHLTLHMGNKPYWCKECGKSFVYKSTYMSHLKAHEADNMFKCDQCPQSGDKTELRRTCNHLTDLRPWLCTVCGKAYPLKSTLKNHMKTHESEKPFRCNDCGKTFKKKTSYECHLKKHSGETPEFMCDQCSQSYFNAFALKRHYVKHTGERQFICDLCDKAFWMKDALKVHRRSHDGERSHPCDRCTKSFAHKHTLVAHLRTHLGDRDLPCSARQTTFMPKYNPERLEIGPLPPLHTGFPLPPSLIMMAPPKHIEMPTLHIL